MCKMMPKILQLKRAGEFQDYKEEKKEEIEAEEWNNKELKYVIVVEKNLKKEKYMVGLAP